MPVRRRDILSRLLTFACTPKGEKALGRLNRLAEKASGADLCVRDDGPADAAWAGLLGLCAEAGTLQADAGYLAFPDEEARRWCNGLWFEEYVKMTLYNLRANKHIRDWASSVRVRREGVLNELDALFSTRNRLFTIECKTTSMLDDRNRHADRVSSVLYKADSLHDHLGGVYARAMLCSVRPLADKDRERARTLGIHVVCGWDALTLADNLISWSKEA